VIPSKTGKSQLYSSA